MTLYLFWDIDGTLLTTARAGIFALEEAAEAVLGERIDMREMRTAGLTDAEIARDLCASRGAGDVAREQHVHHVVARRGEAAPLRALGALRADGRSAPASSRRSTAARCRRAAAWS